MKQYLLNRLREPSTHAGLAVLGISLAQLLFPQYANVIGIIASALGLTAAAVPDPNQKG